ncbi:MAG: hypothetical protein FJ029_14400, partial [Actinobacteria bacterium]|nr:hypothetical protein [Actinomycetota bacterium]
ILALANASVASERLMAENLARAESGLTDEQRTKLQAIIAQSGAVEADENQLLGEMLRRPGQ